MKPFTKLNDLLETAKEKHIFGTKMRSVIREANKKGIKQNVAQQFFYGLKIAEAGLVPILEPEVDIHSESKEEAEVLLKEVILKELGKLDTDTPLMFKLTIPSQPDFYRDLIALPQVVRVVALSGGYSREEANDKLAENHGLIASFSRALAEGLSAGQTDDEFDATLRRSVDGIYAASVT